MIGPVLRRMNFPKAVREALSLRADTFAFIANPSVKPTEIRQGRGLWADRGGVPPLAIVRLPEDPERQAADAMAGLQMAVAAGAGAAVLEVSASQAPGEPHRSGSAAGRDAVRAAVPYGAGVPLLYTLTQTDFDDPNLVPWLVDTGCGWCIDAGRLFASGWWEPRRLQAVGWELVRAGLPGAIWVREPETTASAAAQAPLGLGAMGLNAWWDLFAQPWTVGIPVYAEIPGRGATGGAELHSLRRLMEMARGG